MSTDRIKRKLEMLRAGAACCARCSRGVGFEYVLLEMVTELEGELGRKDARIAALEAERMEQMEFAEVREVSEFPLADVLPFPGVQSS